MRGVARISCQIYQVKAGRNKYNTIVKKKKGSITCLGIVFSSCSLEKNPTKNRTQGNGKGNKKNRGAESYQHGEVSLNRKLQIKCWRQMKPNNGTAKSCSARASQPLKTRCFLQGLCSSLKPCSLSLRVALQATTVPARRKGPTGRAHPFLHAELPSFAHKLHFKWHWLLMKHTLGGLAVICSF